MSRTKKLRIWVEAGVGAIFLIGVIACALGGDAEPAAATAAPTPTVALATQPASAMPAETGCSPAEQAYVDRIAAHSAKFLYHLENMRALNNQVGLAPELVLDAQWQREITTTLTGLENEANAMSLVTGPPSVSPIREDFTFMAAVIAEYTYLYSEAIAQIDAALLNAATEAMGDATRYAQSAKIKVDQLCG